MAYRKAESLGFTVGDIAEKKGSGDPAPRALVVGDHDGHGETRG